MIKIMTYKEVFMMVIGRICDLDDEDLGVLFNECLATGNENLDGEPLAAGGNFAYTEKDKADG